MSLQQLQEVDVKTINIDSLADVTTVSVDMNMPKEQRMREVIRQLGGNPYIFRYKNTIVKVSHANTGLSLDACIENCLRSL